MKKTATGSLMALINAAAMPVCTWNFANRLIDKLIFLLNLLAWFVEVIYLNP